VDGGERRLQSVYVAERLDSRLAAAIAELESIRREQP